MWTHTKLSSITFVVESYKHVQVGLTYFKLLQKMKFGSSHMSNLFVIFFFYLNIFLLLNITVLTDLTCY